MRPRCCKLSAVQSRTQRSASSRVSKSAPAVDGLLRRRVIFVTGKGGTGKTTITAALALLAARADKRVLAIDVEAAGDLAAALGMRAAGSKPQLAQRNVSVIALSNVDSFQEYLNIFFKIPRLTRSTPLGKIFDFIATGVPGPRDMLVVGKIAYEENRRENGRPLWDLIVVDSAASGHAVAHLAAPKALLSLVHGGMIAAQVDWVEKLVRDDKRCTAVVCALPEELPVQEAIELHDRLRAEAEVSVAACVLNRAFTESVPAAEKRLAEALASPAHADAVIKRLGGSPEPLLDAAELASQLHEKTVAYARALCSGVPVPMLTVPLHTSRPGLATTRLVAEDIGGPPQ
jgi:anion-transporting  ArsA/GET3 family ATPase